MSFIDTKEERLITSRKLGSCKTGITVLSYENFFLVQMHFGYKIAVLPNFLLGIFPFLSLAQHSIKRGRQFYKLPDSYLVGNTTSTRHVKDYFDCSFLCLEHEPFACLSFNMARNSNNGYHTCELSSSERSLEPQRIEERLGYDYYGTTTEVCGTSQLFVVLG